MEKAEVSQIWRECWRDWRRVKAGLMWVGLLEVYGMVAKDGLTVLDHSFWEEVPSPPSLYLRLLMKHQRMCGRLLEMAVVFQVQEAWVFL